MVMIERQKIKVIYVMGAGHSGSTLLDIILGNHPEIQSCGELKYNNFLNKYQENCLCTCGQKSQTCQFCNQVIDTWKYRTGIKNIKSYQRLQKKYEDTKIPFNLNWSKSEDFNQYLFYTLEFLKSLSSSSGKNIIVDSSKNPTRAFYLSLIPEIELILIHLIRDGRGVSYSIMKKNPDEKKRIKGWFLTNLQSELVSHRINAKKIRVRYEDLISTPDIVLSKIGRMLNLNFSDISDKLINGSGIPVKGHILAGNRMRFSSDNVVLKQSFEWKEHLSYKDLFYYWIISWPLALKYRYY